MGLAETLVFYLLIGAAVGVAEFLSLEAERVGDQIFRTAAAVLFWPMYLPTLLRRPNASQTADDESPKGAALNDELSQAISQVEAELDTALSSLDGWAENVLSGEPGRLAELRGAWRQQAQRIRELDALLAQPEFLATNCETSAVAPEMDDSHALRNRRSGSLLARQENIDRLREVRRQLFDDLLGTLAWVRELVTMIHLAKFTGAPASRAEELIAQIAASVEGLSEVTAWKNESLAPTAI